MFLWTAVCAICLLSISEVEVVRTEHRDRGNFATAATIGDAEMAYLMDPMQQELPLMSKYLLSQLYPTSPSSLSSHTSIDNSIFIPKQVWIAVRNISDELPKHYFDRNTTSAQKKEKHGSLGFLSRNRNWKVHFCDNAAKDKFMAETFPNTSLLWAYSVLNPAIGAAKAEIWRLAVLYVHGGMYMDDDANIAARLDEVVAPGDKFIIGQEGYDFDDRCFRDSYPLSNRSLTERFGSSLTSERLFGGKFFFNWAMFSMPGHVVLLRSLQHIVNLIKLEFRGDSAIKMGPTDNRGKLLQCASTFPITSVARELVMEAKHIHGMDEVSLRKYLGLHIGGIMFAEYGADIKAWNNDWMPSRWWKLLHHKRLPYLRVYAPPTLTSLQGQVVQASHHKDIFLVGGPLGSSTHGDGKRHKFPDYSTFLSWNFTPTDVQQISHAFMGSIPLGDPIPRYAPRAPK